MVLSTFRRFHFDSIKVLNMIGVKLCIGVDCSDAIDSNILYFHTHYQINGITDDYQQSIFGQCK